MILHHTPGSFDADRRRDQGATRTLIGLSGVGSIVALLILLNLAASLA